MIAHRPTAIALGYLTFVIIYITAPLFAIREPFHLLPLAIDRAIPFLPWTIAIYLSQFALLFLTLWLQQNDRGLTDAFGAMALATFLSCALFVTVPTTIPRPVGGGALFDLLWAFDVPTNCFPSLHVSLAAIAATLWPRDRTRVIVWMWAVLIALSTLTTKQHYFIDVIGGAIVAAVVLTLVRAPWPRPSRPPHTP